MLSDGPVCSVQSTSAGFLMPFTIPFPPVLTMLCIFNTNMHVLFLIVSLVSQNISLREKKMTSLGEGWETGLLLSRKTIGMSFILRVGRRL